MASTNSMHSLSIRQSLERPSTPDHQIASSKHEFEAMATSIEPPSPDQTKVNPSAHDNCERRHEEEENPTISISSTSKIAGQTVAPFLSKHIPDQYAPLGQQATVTQKNPSSKYCYRHRPDLKCRRTANEPSMDNLQRDLETLSSADQQGISHVWSLFSAAPAKHRNLMLQGILTQCCFPQLSYLSTAVSDLIRIDFITALPNELSFKILCYLDTTSLCKAAQVSRSWRAAADDDVVWHKMCEQHIDRKCTKCGWGLPLLERRRLREWKRQQQLRASGRGRNEWSPELTPLPETHKENATSSHGSCGKRSISELDDGTSSEPKRICTSESKSDSSEVVVKPTTKFRPWKEVYKDRFKVGTNWKYGRCSTKVFRGHTNGVMCLQFEDNMLATGSYDCTIKIWDIDSGEVVRTLRGHHSGIRALQFDETKLISGSLDKTIKVWNWRTGECISTYQGHSDGVLSVHFSGNLLASGSIDQTVKIWNFEDKSTFSLRGHTEWVNAVKIDTASRTVFSASDDLTIRLWDLDTRACIKVFEGHVGQVQQVLLLPPDFEWDESAIGGNKDDDQTGTDDGSDNGSSQPHDIDSLHLELSENARQAFGAAFGNGRPLPPKYMLTAGLDSTVRLWCVATGKCLKTFFGHVEGVWALAGDSLRVVSGAQDRMVKIWDPRTGKCDRTFTGHSSAVTCIALSDSRMITGSEDHEVRLYSFKSEEEVAPCREGVDLKWRGRGITELGWAEGAVANVWTPG